MPETLILRRCSLCKIEKPITEFELKKDKPLGRGYRCIPCYRAYTKKWVEANREKARTYCRNYEKIHKQERGKRYLKDLKKHGERHKAYYRKHRQEVRARDALNGAVRYRKIVRPKFCEQCGRPGRIEAHHHLGYAWRNRFNVKWLCAECHGATHCL